MKRRNFLIGISASSTVGAAVLGSGAFSRVESDRYVMIEVAEDPDAYFGLNACDSPNGEAYVAIDDEGHLYVDISENAAGGQGVNSDSRTWFKDLVQLCNQGTDDACIWIERGDNWPTVNEGPYEGQPRVDFYLGSDESILGTDNAVEIGVGECQCIDLQIDTHGLDATAEETLLAEVEDVVTLVADVECPDEVPQPEPAFFAVSNLEPGDVTVTQGDSVEVIATIENTGDEEGTKDIVLVFEGDTIESESLTLTGGDSDTVWLGEHETDELEPGEYNYVVSTDDDEVTGTLTVEEPGIQHLTVSQGEQFTIVSEAIESYSGVTLEENAILRFEPDSTLTITG